jgi:hypothetical protein
MCTNLWRQCQAAMVASLPVCGPPWQCVQMHGVHRKPEKLTS